MFLLTAAASSGMNADTGTITTLHLILIAILIVLVIAAIVWGARQKRGRAAGEAIEAERTETLLAHPQTETAVSPAPPPLGDSGMGSGAVLAEPVTVKSKAAAKPKPVTANALAAKAPVAEPLTDEPAAKPAKPKPAAAPASAYGLIDVKGLGPKAVPLLAAQGIATLADLAKLNAARAAEIDAGLGALSGRMARDKWIAQAKLLAAGDVATFEATYGKL